MVLTSSKTLLSDFEGLMSHILCCQHEVEILLDFLCSCLYCLTRICSKNFAVTFYTNFFVNSNVYSVVTDTALYTAKNCNVSSMLQNYFENILCRYSNNRLFVSLQSQLKQGLLFSVRFPFGNGISSQTI